MIIVHALISSSRVCILGHHCSSFKSPWPSSRTSVHHFCSSVSPWTISSVGSSGSPCSVKFQFLYTADDISMA
ncbi:hypothetical protein ACJIZ3_017603 [Penstemon smallii]|uniref:Uncharacterized protein n=1 Tax=Penstemon smallii TaxID=265156 RepID=A0ABD3SVZ9_9LAMI